MVRIKNLITNKILKKNIAIRTQQLAACMAWQILNDYPRKRKTKNWEIYKNLRGVMLADEVGGGKTFEALSIISKTFLERTGISDNSSKFRVLILANPSIRSKWLWNRDPNEPDCDLQKFICQTKLSKGLKNKLTDFFSSQEVIRSKKQWPEIQKKRQGIWLASFTGLPGAKGNGIKSKFDQKRKRTKVFPKNFFDWIIVDEAHSLKSGNMNEDEKVKLEIAAIRKIYAVINSNDKANLLLLTATPFQNNVNEFKHLLSLLEKTEKKNDLSSLTGNISKGLDKLQSEFNNIQNGNLTIEELTKVLKKLKYNFNNNINDLIGKEEENIIDRPKALKASGNKNGIDDYLRDIMVRNIKEQLAIKPEAAILDESEKLQYLLYRDLVKKSDEEKQMFSTKLSQMVSSEDSFSKELINKEKYKVITKLFVGNMIFEKKITKLKEIIDNIKITNGKTVITIFISWRSTLTTLGSYLKKSGFRGRVFTLKGDDKIEKRKPKLIEIEKANQNNNNNSKIILLVSRVGNEGLDFDKFSNRVIHYDNNFNPAIIDQRNGRVYRDQNILTKKGKVIAGDIEVYQLFLEETYDQRILFIEKEKRKLKNFYLGDSGLQKIFEKLINANKLKDEHEIMKILDSIRIDLTPKKKNLLQKNKPEVE